jgi:hypothetical protein
VKGEEMKLSVKDDRKIWSLHISSFLCSFLTKVEQIETCPDLENEEEQKILTRKLHKMCPEEGRNCRRNMCEAFKIFESFTSGRSLEAQKNRFIISF